MPLALGGDVCGTGYGRRGTGRSARGHDRSGSWPSPSHRTGKEAGTACPRGSPPLAPSCTSSSAVLHTGIVVLLFVALCRMTGAPWRSALVAALFGVLPLRVESVAWVAERKDVLCTFRWMATLLAYTWYAEKPSPFRYAAVLAAFAL